jgi:hypothetical protein
MFKRNKQKVEAPEPAVAVAPQHNHRLPAPAAWADQEVRRLGERMELTGAQVHERAGSTRRQADRIAKLAKELEELAAGLEYQGSALRREGIAEIGRGAGYLLRKAAPWAGGTVLFFVVLGIVRRQMRRHRAQSSEGA